MAVRRNTTNRRTLFRTCGICGKSIITTADTPWVRQIPTIEDGRHRQITTYYCSTGCLQASYKNIGWYDGKADERRKEKEANRDRREYSSRYYAAHREEICARKKAQYWADHEGSLKTIAYNKKKRKLVGQ